MGGADRRNVVVVDADRRHSARSQPPPPPPTVVQPHIHGRSVQKPSEYAFLLRRCIDSGTLAHAEALAERWRVSPHAVLISLGWLQEADYVRELALLWGVPLVDSDQIILPGIPRQGRSEMDGLAMAPMSLADLSNSRSSLHLSVKRQDGRVATVFDATSEPPSVLARRIGSSVPGWRGCALAGRKTIEAAVQRHMRHTMLRRATWGLHRLAPDYSAASPITKRQAVRVGSVAGLVIGTTAVAPDVAIVGWTMAMTIPFLFVVGVRLLAAFSLLWRRRSGVRPDEQAIPDADLPVYTLLVPLFREAHMLAPLVAALRRIDYPQAKLDIRIVLEEADPETLAAAAAMKLPGYIQIVVVPDGMPRTKPKALNFALQLANGEFVGIYDAEDAPEPDQLRKAVAAFRRLGPETACLQAQLNIHNRKTNWLTRQFTLEYSALFDALLPCLARLGLPLPLGGTSNHFRTRALMSSGGWDAFNVTEDADLGLRLHRLGWRTGVIASTTFEEAPERWSVWLPQRTRWLKGWMQTYLVHTRGLSSELVTPTVRGRRFTTAIGVQVLLGGLLLSVLVHPLVYILLVSEIVSGQLFLRPQSLMGAGFWHVAVANFVIGFVASILLGAVTAWRRGYRSLALHVVAMPIYWLLISVAGYRALWQLARDPYRWEKTAHNAHPVMRK